MPVLYLGLVARQFSHGRGHWFAFTARGNRLTADAERRKLELVSDTARKVWG